MLVTFRNLLRLFAIIRVVAHYQIDFLTERFFLFRALSWISGLKPSTRRYRRDAPPEKRLREALEKLGPTFVKFGQALSTRMDALPEKIGLEMKQLQDKVLPFSFEQVRETVEESLEETLESAFIEFEVEPVASASVAQVHHAITRDGQEVAVKVMRPDAESKVEADIRILTALGRLIDSYAPEWKRLHVLKVVEEFSETIRKEMDFTIEATHAQQLYENFKDDEIILVPQVFWQFTGRRVLTLEWVSGMSVSDYLRNRPMQPSGRVVAENIITIFFNQVFRDGYFHADQHPGNIFVLPKGVIGVVDFGIMGQVSLQTRLWLADIMRGFLMRDYRKVAQIHLDAEYVPPETDMDAFEDACRQVGEPIFGQPLKKISIADLLGKMFKVAQTFEMEVQPQLLLLQKTMFTLEGVGREIYPDLNMWKLTEPLVRAWMQEHFGPKGRYREIRKDLRNISHFAGYVPKLLHRGLERLAHDRLQLRLNPDFLDRLTYHLESGFKHLVVTAIHGFIFLGAILLAAGEASPWLYGPLLAFALLGFLKTLVIYHR
ncbi:2-polyprenylphenol 6-hydroxylase [Magnetococcales bacterium HHB-1]